MTQMLSCQKNALRQLPEPIQNLLFKRPLDQLSFLPAHLVNSLIKESGLDKANLGLCLLPLAASYAVTPISGFNVGAVGFDTAGNAYLGANFEFINTHIGQTIHAEQSAIAHMWQRGAQDLALLVINYPPCGHCRQFINEVKLAQNFLIQLPDSEAKPLDYYLPESFGAKDLGIDRQILGTNTPLELNQIIDKESNINKTLTGDEILLNFAQNAHDNAHAPYSNSKSGVAILFNDGENNSENTLKNTCNISTGRYAENAAFNPTLPALQVALNYRRMQGYNWKNIQRVIMVESVTTISQRENTTALLSTIAPSVNLEYHITTQSL